MLKNLLSTISLLGTHCLHGEWKWQWKWLHLDKLKQCAASLSHSASALISTTEAIKSTSLQEVEKHAKLLSAFGNEFLACVNINDSSDKLQEWFFTLLKNIKKENLITELSKCNALTDLSEKFSELAQCVTNFKEDDLCEQLLLNYEKAERALTSCLLESAPMKRAFEQAFEQIGLSDLGPLMITSSFYVLGGLLLISAISYRKEIVNVTVNALQACFSRDREMIFSDRRHERSLVGAEAGLLPRHERVAYNDYEDHLSSLSERHHEHHPSLRRRKPKSD